MKYSSMFKLCDYNIQLKYGFEGYRQFPLPRAQVYFQNSSKIGDEPWHNLDTVWSFLRFTWSKKTPQV